MPDSTVWSVYLHIASNDEIMDKIDRESNQKKRKITALELVNATCDALGFKLTKKERDDVAYYLTGY